MSVNARYALILGAGFLGLVGAWICLPQATATDPIRPPASTPAPYPNQQGVKLTPTPQDNGDPILSRFMRQKVGASNDVLLGLVLNDLQIVSDAAERLSKMSGAEHWRISNDPTYSRFHIDYAQNVKSLGKAARSGRINDATIAWNRVTTNCVQCHKWVRNVLIADHR